MNVHPKWFYNDIRHEMAHVLGFGAGQGWREMLQLPSGPAVRDTHFPGPLAVGAFNALGGAGYGGAKVPVANGAPGTGSPNSHWRYDVMHGEMMARCGADIDCPVSLITIQALADLGWSVDTRMAEPYRVP